MESNKIEKSAYYVKDKAKAQRQEGTEAQSFKKSDTG
jgi:hypothetical protein